MTPADPDMSPVNPDVLQQLRALDPAREVLVDVTSLRAKVAAKMAAEGLDFEASNSTASTDASAPSQSPQSATAPGSDNVVDLASRRPSWKRNWLIGLSAAAAVAAVGITGWNQLVPDPQAPTPTISTSDKATNSPRLSAAASLIPGAAQRLSEVGDVSFVAGAALSTQSTTAPAYRLGAGTKMSTQQVQQMAQSLGMGGNVQKSAAGYTVSGPNGATLQVVVGELTYMSFDNPAAVQMECVPVTQGDGNVELPSPRATPTNPTKKPSTSPSPNVETPTAQPTPTPDEPIELPKPEPSKQVTTEPTDTPAEPLPPAVRPDLETMASAPGAKSSTGESSVEIGELHVLVTTTPEPSPQTSTEEEAQPQATRSATPKDPGCVMRAVGSAPTTSQALAEVQKVAAALGAQVLSAQAGATSKDGITTVDVPVVLPGQEQAQNWRAVVTANGVASIKANLGKETKVGDYQVISPAQAVKRLNDPKFGPLDVYDPKGAGTKINGKIELVEATLTNAPIKQKNGSILSMPVYQITDTAGRVWTVLAVADGLVQS